MLIACELLIFAMVYYEYKFHRVAATPIVVLGGIYMVFMPLINIIGVNMDFLPLTDKTIFFFTFFLFVLFLGGQFWTVFYRKRRYVYSSVYENKLTCKKNYVWYFFLLGLISYIINLIQVINIYGIDNTKSNAFGIFAHIGFVSRCLLPIIIYYAITEKKIKYIIAIIVNVIAMILFKGKYHLYIPIAGFVSLFLLIKQDIKMIRLFRIVCLTFGASIILFVSVYTIIPNLIAGDTSFNTMIMGIGFSVKHFFHYLFCPFITANEYFDTPCYIGLNNGLRTVFNPIDRLYQWIFGKKDYFDPAIELWPVIDESGATGNVGGIFSETVLNIGYEGSVIYLFLIGFLVYYFFNKTLCTGKRLVTTIYLVGMLMVCFFCNYFSLLPNLECFIIVYCVDVFIFDNHFKIGKVKLFK